MHHRLEPVEVPPHPLDAALALHQHVAAGVVEVHHEHQSALVVCPHCGLGYILREGPNCDFPIFVFNAVGGEDV